MGETQRDFDEENIFIRKAFHLVSLVETEDIYCLRE